MGQMDKTTGEIQKMEKRTKGLIHNKKSEFILWVTGSHSKQLILRDDRFMFQKVHAGLSDVDRLNRIDDKRESDRPKITLISGYENLLKGNHSSEQAPGDDQKNTQTVRSRDDQCETNMKERDEWKMSSNFLTSMIEE